MAVVEKLAWDILTKEAVVERKAPISTASITTALFAHLATNPKGGGEMAGLAKDTKSRRRPVPDGRLNQAVAIYVLSSLVLSSAFAPSSPIVKRSPGERSTSVHFSAGSTSSAQMSQGGIPSLQRRSRCMNMVVSDPKRESTSIGASSSAQTGTKSGARNAKGRSSRSRPRKKIKRRRTETEIRVKELRESREAQYQEVREKSGGSASIWSFESLFPSTVFDEDAVRRDLYEVNERDGRKLVRNGEKGEMMLDTAKETKKGKRRPYKTGSRAVGNQRLNAQLKRVQKVGNAKKVGTKVSEKGEISNSNGVGEARLLDSKPDGVTSSKQLPKTVAKESNSTETVADNIKVDTVMTRMVEDKVFGMRRSPAGDFEYDTSLVREGAVQFRDGVRLGNALKVNADRLNYHAKKEQRHGRLEEARELYEQAIDIDPRDGRAYLGLSRIAQKRRDFVQAGKWLRAGIANSGSRQQETRDGVVISDLGANPYLLQALGCLEERMGHLAEAEALFVEAAKSRPSHAAAWVSLAQLRTRKLRQGANAGRACYQTAETQLRLAGLPQSSYVYTAWAAMEYKKASDVRRAGELFELALKCDPKCSAAWLQLGVMEAENENWERSEECFETVLKFDRKNSRVIQAYALMKSKRPEGSSRTAIDLFDRALKVNPRDAGNLQAYALYVAKLGDVDAARDLLRRGTEANKRHAPVWQAWGVLETRHGTADEARDIFQQGIWACAQMGGGQSGGRRCARLWQAWGVLEAREGDYAAARRCFGRALDADNLNVAAVTAWAKMEEGLDKIKDARFIFERALKLFPSSSDDKLSLWRAYELMEQRNGNRKESQNVYQRNIRESMVASDVHIPDGADVIAQRKLEDPPDMKSILKRSKEVEVVRWQVASDGMNGEVWLNNGAFESKVPASAMKKFKDKQANRGGDDRRTEKL